MERKTQLSAEDGKHDIIITREFDLPLELLFLAYTDAEIVAQWMTTSVVKLENKNHGSWQFETKDAQGKVVFRANGTIHEFSPNKRIVRTFEMENSPFPVQLEFLDFEHLTDDKSKLTMHMIFRSAADRDRMLRLPFAQGLNMAHDRLQNIVHNIR